MIKSMPFFSSNSQKTGHLKSSPNFHQKFTPQSSLTSPFVKLPTGFNTPVRRACRQQMYFFIKNLLGELSIRTDRESLKPPDSRTVHFYRDNRALSPTMEVPPGRNPVYQNPRWIWYCYAEIVKNFPVSRQVLLWLIPTVEILRFEKVSRNNSGRRYYPESDDTESKLDDRRIRISWEMLAVFEKRRVRSHQAQLAEIRFKVLTNYTRL